MPPAKWEISAGDFPCLNSFFGCSAAAFKRLQSAGSSTPHLVSRPVPNNAAQFLFSARRFRLDFDRPHSPLQRCGVQFWGLGVVIHLPRAILVLLDNDTPKRSITHHRCYLMWKIPFIWQGCFWNILSRVSSCPRCVSGNLRTGGSLG
jgi:hypothetical protein